MFAERKSGASFIGVLQLCCCVAQDALMRDHFGQFGTVQDVRVFKDKGFAFIKYVTRCLCLLTLLLVKSVTGSENYGN